MAFYGLKKVQYLHFRILKFPLTQRDRFLIAMSEITRGYGSKHIKTAAILVFHGALECGPSTYWMVIQSQNKPRFESRMSVRQ
jgi:hypothetical protein